MDDNHIIARVTLDLDTKWANNLTPDELRDFLKAKLDHALGFRGHVRKVKAVLPK